MCVKPRLRRPLFVVALALALAAAAPQAGAVSITRSAEFTAAQPISNGAIQHTSSVSGVPATFKYDWVSASDFNDPNTYNHTALTYSASLYGGAFGATAGYALHDRIGWTDTNGSGYHAIEGYTLSPIAGYTEVSVSGTLSPVTFNSRNASESATVAWKLVYSTDGTNAQTSVLASGSFVMKNNGSNQGMLVSGTNTLSSVAVSGFASGYLGLWLRNSYTGEVTSGGASSVLDQLTYTFSATSVPEPALLPLIAGGGIVLRLRRRRP